MWFVCTEQLASAEWWELRGLHAPELPPEATLQDVLRDLVEAPTLPSGFSTGFPSPAAAGELPTQPGILASILRGWNVGQLPVEAGCTALD